MLSSLVSLYLLASVASQNTSLSRPGLLKPALAVSHSHGRVHDNHVTVTVNGQGQASNRPAQASTLFEQTQREEAPG